MDQDKAILFAKLIPAINFIVADKFNDTMEQKVSWFLVLTKVFQALVQV
jgi:hypothetical protein